jgi:hypothetical protein
MFIIDDLLLSPMKGFMWLVRELHGAAEREFADERERTLRALQSLHMRLEAGQIDEDEFDEEEARLLDRLDELDGVLGEDEAEDEEDDEAEDEEDEPSPPDAERADATDPQDPKEESIA